MFKSKKRRTSFEKLAAELERKPAAPSSKPVRSRRTVEVSRASAAIAVVLILALAAWGAAMSVLALSGDPVARRLMTQSRDLQDKYEQRLLAYKAEIARLTFAMEQTKFDGSSVKGRVVELGQRLQTVELRLAALLKLEGIIGGTPAVGSGSGPMGAAPPPPPPPPPKAPLRKSEYRPGDVDGARIWLVAAPTYVEPAGPRETDVGPALDAIEARLGKARVAESFALDRLARVAGSQVAGFKAAIADLALDDVEVSDLAAAHGQRRAPNAVLPLSDERSKFGVEFMSAVANVDLTYKARAAVVSLPVSRPTVPGIPYSSPFGYRMHPILHQLILHEGIDLAAPLDTPVFAAASGVVTIAAPAGGYGNLIQIDHGAGVTSRYGHLTTFLVTQGQTVQRGQLIAKSGTTGRSTGPHIHFETRIAGVPFDPTCFLRAGNHVFPADTTALPPCVDHPKWPH